MTRKKAPDIPLSLFTCDECKAAKAEERILHEDGTSTYYCRDCLCDGEPIHIILQSSVTAILCSGSVRA